jgi:GNAT superfamily N-acetyltransferase
MQEYVNIDYHRVISVVALVGKPDQETIIAESRYSMDDQTCFGDLAVVVDESYQGLGIATYLYNLLIRLAKERGLKGFTAEVLQANKGMMKVFKKGDLPINARLHHGVYSLTIPFEVPPSQTKDDTI